MGQRLKLVPRNFLIAATAALVGFAIVALPTVARADDVVQGFAAKGSLRVGEIVALADSPANTVKAAPGDNSTLIFGVVVDGATAPVTITRAGQDVYVSDGGDYPVFVDNQNGPVAKGDYVSISATAGIGDKATADQPMILGRALSGFDGVHGVSGQTGKYALGKVTVALGVRQNPLFKNTLAIPEPLQKLGNTIAGREVSPLKVYVALVLFMVAAAFTVLLLIVGIRAGLISIGRNPLSRHLILRGLFEVIGAGIVIFIASLVGVYLLLRL